MHAPRTLVAAALFAGLLALWPIPAAADPPLFNCNYVFYPTSIVNHWGWATAAADVDHDGYADMLAVPSGDDGVFVAVWRGSAHGLQPTATFYRVEAEFDLTNYLEVEDVNGDGWEDAVVTSTDILFVLPNLGNGTFGPPVAIPAVGSEDDAVAVVDFNGDGKPDLALASSAQNEVRILLGDGAFGFTEGRPLLTHANPSAIEVEDFDENGLPDLMVRSTGTSQVFFAQGGGVFVPIDIPGRAEIASDLDQDGHEDIITDTSVLLGNGNGTFQPPIAHGVPGIAGAVDLDGDSYPELLGTGLAYYGPSRAVTVSRALGHGLFGPPVPDLRFERSFGPLASADFDGDGRPDVGLSASESGFSFVMRGLGDGRFEQAPWVAMPASPKQIAVGRLDADVANDLIVLSDKLRTWLQQGGAFVPKDSSAVISTSAKMGVFDTNGDGLADVVLAGGSSYSVWLTQPGGGLGPRQDHALAGNGFVAFGDVNLDGFQDFLFTTTSGSPTSYIYYCDHSGGFSQSATTVAPFVSRMFIADMDGDGLQDLVGGSPLASSGMRIQYGAVPGPFTFPPVEYSGNGVPLAVGRVDADALPDVLVANGTSQSLYRNLGARTFTSPLALPATVEVPTTVADLDGDGDVDLIRGTSGGASVQLSNGDGTFAPVVGYGALWGFLSGQAIGVGDVDGDSHPDLLIAADQSFPTVSILLNQTGKPVLSAPPAGPPKTARGLALVVSPNPSRGRVTAAASFARGGSAKLELFDVRGRRVLAREIATTPGRQEFSIGETGAFAPGLYFVRVRSGAESASARICIAR